MTDSIACGSEKPQSSLFPTITITITISVTITSSSSSSRTRRRVLFQPDHAEGSPSLSLPSPSPSPSPSPYLWIPPTPPLHHFFCLAVSSCSLYAPCVDPHRRSHRFHCEHKARPTPFFIRVCFSLLRPQGIKRIHCTYCLSTVMADQKTSLLPPRPAVQEQNRPSRSIFQGMDLSSLKKRGQGVRSWIKIDKEGDSQVMEVDKLKIMRRCDLPARDLRLLDPLFVYPSTILGREKAIVVNLEQIRCIITADEVLLLNSLDNYVLQYVAELQKRLAVKNKYLGGPSLGAPVDVLLGERRESSVVIYNALTSGHDQQMIGESRGSSGDYMPFEFLAMEVALEAACTFLDTQATELEVDAYPALDELTSKISTLNLERVRRLKSRLLALTRRVQKVRDEIEQLMDDDGDMAEMYLTVKKERLENYFYKEQAGTFYAGLGAGGSMSAPVSPVCSLPESRKMDKNLSMAASRHSSSRVSDEGSDIQELEMLLEAYFVVIDAILNKLTSLKEYIDDTEDFINIQLDNVRNQLIQFELILTMATFVVAIFGVVAGIFGMNIPIELFEEPRAFKWVLIITAIAGLLVFASFMLYFRRRGLMTL